MSIKNKDLYRLMEEYSEIFKKKTILENNTPGAEALADTVSDDVSELNKSKKSENTSSSKYDLSKVWDPDAISQEIKKFPQTDLDQWSRRTVDMLVNSSFALKQPLLLLGNPGVSKSAGVKKTARQVANASTKGKYIQEDDYNMATDEYERPEGEEGGSRIFAEWNKLSNEEKDDVYARPEKYFIQMDLNGNQMDRLSLIGIPKSGDSDKDYQECRKDRGIAVLCRQGLEGVVFLDEINLAPEDVIGILLRFVLEREVGDEKISDGLSIVAASNIPGVSGTDSTPVSTAFLNRMDSGIGVLVLEPEEWCDWAEANGVDPVITSFIRDHPDDYFYTKMNLDDVRAKGVPFRTPRSLMAFSKIFSKAASDYQKVADQGRTPRVPFPDYIMQRGSAIIETDFMKAFLSWYSEMQRLSLDEILKHKDLGREDKTQIKNAKVGSIVYFMRNVTIKAFNLLERSNAPIPELKNDDPKERISFIKTYVDSNKEVHKYLESLVIVISRLHDEYIITLINMLREKLNESQYKLLLSFIAYGNYDQGVKKDALDAMKKAKEIF